ncbi:MAG: ATP-binding protein [Mollicutes bacterium]|nr:ATP-binding protein [Mollicutes bacterium]MDY6070359.1 ATP-binding protein [Bacilli bacterium]
MFKRDLYLKELIDKKQNHLVKVITGIRRSGKSYLLNTIFYNYLIKEENVPDDHIIRFAFDNDEDIFLLDKYLMDQPTIIEKNNQKLVNSRKFLCYIKDLVRDNDPYYFLLDEIQNLDEFVRTLNAFLRHENYDVYVTGSNSRFLSSEVDTEFGGRGDRIHLLPLTFSEFLNGTDYDANTGLKMYERYGGIPLIQLQKNDTEKAKQTISILNETYIKDVKDRHPNVNVNNLNDTLNVIASMISTLINPSKIEKTFKGVYNIDLTNDAIGNYISWFEEAYLLNKALRYDVKGRQYIGTPYKIYFEDVGIRNAALNFRDVDETNLIENIVYNELRYRGFNVDIGLVHVKKKTERKDKNNNWIYVDTDTECDFVANKGDKTYYIQVALTIDTEKKKDQEYESLRNIPDSFKKVIVVKNEGLHYRTKEGFLRISLLDFLTHLDSLDW